MGRSTRGRGRLPQSTRSTQGKYVKDGASLYLSNVLPACFACSVVITPPPPLSPCAPTHEVVMSLRSLVQPQQLSISVIVGNPAFQVLLGSLIVSFGPIMVRGIDSSPPSLGFYRMLTGAAIFAVIVAWHRGVAMISGRALAAAAAAGFFLSCDITFWHRSIHLIGPGFATIIGNFQVFILGAAAVLLWRERLRREYYLGVFCAMVGLSLTLKTQLAAIGSQSVAGIAFGLLSSFAYAAYVIMLRQKPRDRALVTLYQTMFVICAVGTVTFLAEGVLLGVPAWSASAGNIVSLIGYGLSSQVIGWLIIARAVPLVPTSTTAVLLLMQPLGAYVWEIVLLGRAPGWIELFGASLMLLGVILGGVPPRRLRRREGEPT